MEDARSEVTIIANATTATENRNVNKPPAFIVQHFGMGQLITTVSGELVPSLTFCTRRETR